MKFNQKLVPSNLFKFLSKTSGRRRLDIQEKMNKLVEIKFRKDPTADLNEEELEAAEN